MSSWFPQWQLKQASPGEVVAPDERLPWGKTLIQGAQHTVTMFGATVLAPLLMGFDPNVAILMSGVGTLLFFLVVGGRVPSYLGSSFAFIGAVIAVTGYAGSGLNKNIGVMAVTRIYSTLVFCVAALFAVFLGFSPKFGALIQTIPAPVIGGVSIVVFGLITAVGARIWVQNQVDFDDNRNLIVVAVTLILGAGDFTLKIGDFALGGIGTATFGAVLLNLLLRDRESGQVG